jgi:hypothetical protein
VFDAFGGDELVGDLFHQGGLAADNEDLEAIVVVEVDVQSRDNDLVMIVLDIGEGGLDVLFVVVVKEGDGAGNFLGANILVMLDQAGANHIGDGERAVVVTFFARHLVELFGQRARDRNSKPDDPVGSMIFHEVDLNRAGSVVNGIDAAGLWCYESFCSSYSEHSITQLQNCMITESAVTMGGPEPASGVKA